jgi:hypothetical protein
MLFSMRVATDYSAGALTIAMHGPTTVSLEVVGLPGPSLRFKPEATDVLVERQWDERFARSKGALAKLAARARANYAAGRTEPLDPDAL